MNGIGVVEAELPIALDGTDRACGVLWLAAESPDDTLSTVAERVFAEFGEATAYGALGLRDASSSSSLSEMLRRDPSQMSAMTLTSNEGVSTQLVELGRRDGLFWDLFSEGHFRRRLCAALFRAEGAEMPSRVAAMQLTMSAASVPLLRQRSWDHVQEALSIAFIAETIAVDGLAVLQIHPELMGPCMAITGRQETINRLASDLNDLEKIAPRVVSGSVQIGGAWPQ